MTTSGRRKLSCYVDETGQDTGGAFFLVAVVVTAEERDQLTALLAVAPDDYRVTIFIDGLPRSKERWFGSELRHLRIATKKVRGVRREENDALMRLADALAGFVRAALEKKGRFPALLRIAEKHEFIKEI